MQTPSTTTIDRRYRVLDAFVRGDGRVMDEAPIVVSGPAVPSTLRVLRGVAASVAAGLDAPFDRIDELRIAVDEAATLVLGTVSPRLLTLELRLHDDGLTARIRSDGSVSDWPGGTSRSWAGKVLDALTENVRFALDEEGCPQIDFGWSVHRGDRGQ